MMKIAVLLALLCSLVAAQPGDENIRMCRTRALEAIERASNSRVVFTPIARKGSLTANAFFPAASYAGILTKGVGLGNVAPCVFSAPDLESGGTMAWSVVRGGVTKDVFPSPTECVDSDSKKLTSLADINAEVIVVVHGNAYNARVDVAFGPEGDLERESFSADEMANMLVESGLPCDARKVTVLVVRGGFKLTKEAASRRYVELYRKMQVAGARKNKKLLEQYKDQWSWVAMESRSANTFEMNDDVGTQEIPFIVMLANSLKERGFDDIKVQGVRAEVKAHMNPSGPTGPYHGLQVLITTKDLAEGTCAKQHSDKKKRELCVDDLMAPCDKCLLERATESKSFDARLAECRKELARDHPDSAKICGVAHQDVSDKWLFSVSSSQLPAQ